MMERPGEPGSAPRAPPLAGVRVVEVGQLLAGPFAGAWLAYFGAEVIKVEPPGGDPIRRWRHLEEGTSLWWRSLARNKKCVTLDLRVAEGRAACRSLLDRADVLVENFRPGTLEKWGLDPTELRRSRPELVVARISGFGQTGPYRERPGYASVCEAMGGLRYLTGVPGEVPVRANLSLGDTLGGLHAALGVLLALFERQRSGQGQLIDVSLQESVLAVLESVVPEQTRAGVVRQPAGTSLTGVVPSDAYPCLAGEHVIIGANGTSVFKRLARAIGREDLAARPDLEDNPGRVAARTEIDEAIAAWTRSRSVAEVTEALQAAEVPVGPIYDAKALCEDPHLSARGAFETMLLGGSPLVLPAMYPRMTDTPGETTWAGPDEGAHDEEILGGWLGMSPDERKRAAGRR
jgi:crotonobetainyl-CoA:carnitine CoA-transferase CaiB-like acyl-CoA transferase